MNDSDFQNRVGITRCAWVNLENPLYVNYHDEEWWKPVYDDTTLFEFLILEGAQAWLSWETVLAKRENYQGAFCEYRVDEVAALSDEYLEELLENQWLIRNRLKIFSVRKNAQIFQKIQREFGSFSHYLWSFVDNEPIINTPDTLAEIPAVSELSKALSKDLKKRGMSFVWPTIMYAYLQAVGVVDDHTTDCFCKQ